MPSSSPVFVPLDHAQLPSGNICARPGCGQPATQMVKVGNNFILCCPKQFCKDYAASSALAVSKERMPHGN